MKKTVSFTKNLEFPTMIGEITEITLEDSLKFIDSNNIEGNFFIGGKYKMTGASILEENFSFNIPVEISVLEKLDLSTCKVSIADFTYEIIDDDILKTDVEVLIEGVEIVEDDKDEEIKKQEINSDIERECDGDSKEDKEIEIPVKKEVIKPKDLEVNFEQKENKIVEELELPKDNIDNSTNSLFSNLADEDDSFSTYSIYIMRDGDTIEKVMEKYGVSKDELLEYNDLSSITLNSKVIIPTSINE